MWDSGHLNRRKGLALIPRYTCRVAAPDLTISADGGTTSSAEHGYGRILARAIFLPFLFPFVRDEYPPRAYFAFIPPRMNALFSLPFPVHTFTTRGLTIPSAHCNEP